MVILDANGEQRMLNVERDIWHSLGCIERGSVNECVSPDGYFENNRYYDMIMMTKLKKKNTPTQLNLNRGFLTQGI